MSKSSNQVTISRRSFLAAASTLAVAIPARGESASHKPASNPQAIDIESLAHLLLMVEMLREWYRVHEDELRAVRKVFGYENPHDLFVHGAALARAVGISAGIELDRAFIASFAADCEAKFRAASEVEE
jgi:hypothetical protein